jgi:hypothetical protein
MQGFSWPFPQKAFRPPNALPYAVFRAPAFSFLKRDPHAPALAMQSKYNIPGKKIQPPVYLPAQGCEGREVGHMLHEMNDAKQQEVVKCSWAKRGERVHGRSGLPVFFGW